MESEVKRMFKLKNETIYLIVYENGDTFIPESITDEFVIENLLRHIDALGKLLMHSSKDMKC